MKNVNFINNLRNLLTVISVIGATKKMKRMFQNSTTMMSNTVELAKKQLEIHAKAGSKSNLSIYEVAELMDTVRKMSKNNQREKPSIFYSFSNN